MEIIDSELIIPQDNGGEAVTIDVVASVLAGSTNATLSKMLFLYVYQSVLHHVICRC